MINQSINQSINQPVKQLQICIAPYRLRRDDMCFVFKILPHINLSLLDDFWWELVTLPTGRLQSIAMNVCLSVRISQIPHCRTFGARCLCPWLGHFLMALRYLMYFRFCGWRRAFTQCASWCVGCIRYYTESVTAKSTASIPTKFQRSTSIHCCVVHRGRSLLCTITLWDEMYAAAAGNGRVQRLPTERHNHRSQWRTCRHQPHADLPVSGN